MQAVDTPKSQSTDWLTNWQARWEREQHCQCDGSALHGHCWSCKIKLPEGEHSCEECDLKVRQRHCPGCGGSFYVAKGDGDVPPFDFRGTGVCSAVCRERLFNKFLFDSGATAVGLEKTLENFIPHTPALKRQLEKLTAWKDGKLGAGVFLSGPPGTGKTHVGSALMRALCQRGLNGQFIKCCTFTLRCQAAFSNDQTVLNIVDELLRGQFLVLDDIGVEKATDYVRQSLVYLMDEILTRKKILIATSNKTLDQLAPIDPRFPDRIVELCDQYEFRGPSYRPRLSKARATQQCETEVSDDTISFALSQGSRDGNGTGRLRGTMNDTERYAKAAAIRKARAADQDLMLKSPF